MGGEPAHLYSLKFAHRFVNRGVTIIPIAPNQYHSCSDMGPGVLSGMYNPEEVRFDINVLIESRGGKFVGGRVCSIAPMSIGVPYGSTKKARSPVSKSLKLIDMNMESEYISIKLVSNSESC